MNNIAIEIAGKAMSKSSGWVVVHDDKFNFLVGKRSQKVSNGGQWGLFGGTIDDGENPKKGAVRELEEEIGLKAKPKDLQFLWRDEHPGDKRHSYYYKLVVSKKPKVKINWETEKTKWLSLKDMMQLTKDDRHFSLQGLVRELQSFNKKLLGKRKARKMRRK